jgi:hypothetical protein
VVSSNINEITITYRVNALCDVFLNKLFVTVRLSWGLDSENR